MYIVIYNGKILCLFIMFFILSFLYHYLTMCLKVGMLLCNSYLIGLRVGIPK